MDQNKAIEKIRKCLALAGSSNPHEAAAAMRQAQALMEKFQVDSADLLAAEATEEGCRSGAKSRPASWETSLANLVSKAFGCHLLFEETWSAGSWKFIGVAPGPEIASYTMAVLLREVRKARNSYIAEKLKRCKTATKTKRADLFCNGWVRAVWEKVHAFAGEKPQAAIDAYLAKQYSELGKLESLNRNADMKPSQRASNDIRSGIEAAAAVNLNHGMSAENRPQLN
jgi:hypothetical protein